MTRKMFTWIAAALTAGIVFIIVLATIPMPNNEILASFAKSTASAIGGGIGMYAAKEFIKVWDDLKKRS